MRPSDSPRLRLASLILATAGCLVAPFTFQVTVNPNETEVIRGQTFEISVTVAVEGITFNEADLRFVGEVPGPLTLEPLNPGSFVCTTNKITYLGSNEGLQSLTCDYVVEVPANYPPAVYQMRVEATLGDGSVDVSPPFTLAVLTG